MYQTGIIVGSLLILSGFSFLTMSYEVPSYAQISYWFASILILGSGALFVIKSKDSQVSVFVCGECNRHFFNEVNLRKHYAKEHVKKQDPGSKPQ